MTRAKHPSQRPLDPVPPSPYADLATMELACEGSGRAGEGRECAGGACETQGRGQDGPDNLEDGILCGATEAHKSGW